MNELIDIIGNQNGPITWVLLVLFIYELKKILNSYREINEQSMKECRENNKETRDIVNKSFADHKEFVVKLLDKIQSNSGAINASSRHS